MPATLDIDLIVREVLKRLAQIEAAPVETKAESGMRKAEETDSSVLIVAERVVTIEGLRGKLDQVRRVQVRPKAVVTPAVRDLLREKKIVLEVGAATTAKADRPVVRLAAGVADTTFNTAGVLRSLSNTGVNVEQLARTGMKTVVSELADQVRKNGSLALLFTEQTLAAVCLANRFPGVRAAAGGCVPSVEKAQKAIGVNLLVVNPRGKSASELENIVKTFCRNGSPACPELLAN